MDNKRCLKCNRVFRSKGKFNMLCTSCKVDAVEGPSPAIVYRALAPNDIIEDLLTQSIDRLIW